MLTLNKLTVGYRGHSVLEPISLSLEEGESLLIVGSNGAGKSTLIRTIFGLLPPVAGSVNVMGIEVRLGILSTLVQKGVRFLGQGNRAFGDMTTEEQAGVMFQLYGSERSTDAPLPSSRTRGRVGTLSIGQRRIEALRLLDSKDSRMFALDEPRMGLDMYSSRPEEHAEKETVSSEMKDLHSELGDFFGALKVENEKPFALSKRIVVHAGFRNRLGHDLYHWQRRGPDELHGIRSAPKGQRNRTRRPKQSLGCEAA